MAKKEDEEVIDRGDDFIPTDDDDELDADLGISNDDDDYDDDLEDDEGSDTDDLGDDDPDNDDEASEDDDEDKSKEEDDDDEGDHRIPKARLDEVIAQRELEREQNKHLQEQMDRMMTLMEKGQPKVEKPKEKEKFTYDFDAKEAEYMEAVLNDNAAEATKLRKEIRTAERKMFSEEMETVRGTAVKEAKGEAQRIRDQAKFEKTIMVNEEKFTFLDQNAEDYNQKAVDKVNDLFGKFSKAGMTQADALQEAIDLVAPAYAKPTPKDKGTGLGGKRKREALKKNADASRKQPARMRGKSAREGVDDYNLSTMTDREYAKLPASVKRKLRGD